MIKVLVVVSGLVLFVPDAGQDPAGLSVLLYRDAVHGIALRQQLDAYSYRAWKVASGFKAGLTVANGKTFDLTARHNFPEFKLLTLQPEHGRSRTDCLQGSCSQGQNELVAGLVRFEGGWRTRAVSRCDQAWDLPPDFRDQAEFQFKRGRDNYAGYHQQIGQRRFATGLALEAEVRRIEDLKLVVDGYPQSLEPSKPDACLTWIGDAKAPCVVLELENWSDMPLPKDCQGPNPKEECLRDLHFADLYRLVVNPQGDLDRWIPVVVNKYTSCKGEDGPGHYPAVRCPNAFAEP